jgi:hypothetical protein
MGRFCRRFFDRNVLLAVGVLPPTVFLFGGHVWQGLVFLACVVAARLSVPPQGTPRRRALPTRP